jgi:long-chain acyl-CoA synthetase
MTHELLQRMQRGGKQLALATVGATHDYEDLLTRVSAWHERLAEAQLPPGAVVSIEGDYAAETVAAFISLIEYGAIVVPLSQDSQANLDAFIHIGQVEWRIQPRLTRWPWRTGHVASHHIYSGLRNDGAPGLVLFSSGSTGKPKAAVHDLNGLLRKFEVPRNCYRTLVFLQLDHIGGVNTLLYTLYNGGSVIVPADRSPRAVAEMIERYRVELLPTSPTFLNLLLLSGVNSERNLSSLKLITYGTEPMPESTLKRAAHAFPQARLLQTYGLTEVGILRSQSRGSNSLWVRVGGEGYETKVVDGRLWVKASSAMLGYLNAPSPFDPDGFLDTGDKVEIEGEWLRILGRESDIINVGGTKVYPAEVEDVLLQMDGVVDAVVRGEPHPIIGNIVVATVVLGGNEVLTEFKVRMRRFCKTRLAPFKVPGRVILAAGPLHSARFKRMRQNIAPLRGRESR